MQIPQANTPEREEFNKTVVGTLGKDDGKFLCLTCSGPDETKVYGVNIAPYSAVCHKCGTITVDGAKGYNGNPLTLF